MATIEERVVSMQMNNAQFLAASQQTINALNALNRTLQLQGATKGLQNVQASAQKVPGSLKNIESATTSIADRFRAMSVVATTALATITHQAVSAGARMIKSLTIDPIIQGYKEYETKLNSIQTILANTAHEGTNLKQVTAALNELNRYSDQTIYNFGEMAKNIGTFTAAGVSLKHATAAIKGIANLAAVSGSNSQQASAAMYQLSQALAAGKVSLEDWNSVVNAGMGGKVFQDALMETARVHGVAIDKMVKDAGSFRLTLQEGWLTGEILNETLMKFTGDLNAAQLKSMGYNEKQIAGIIKMGKIATAAATEVKTFSQLISTVKESIGSGWAQTWELIFGDFEEAKQLWTGVNNVIGGFIERSADARNKVLADWDALGGRTVLIEGIGNAFKALMAFLKPIKDAFREIFPAKTGQDLYNLTVAFRNFTQGLIIGSKTADNLRRTFAGVFAIFGIVWDLIKALIGTFFDLTGTVTKGSGGFLEITARIGDFLVGLRKAIKDGDVFGKVFGAIGEILAVPIKILQFFGRILAALFDGFDAGRATNEVSKFTKSLSPMEKLGNLISSAWNKVVEVVTNVWESFGPLADKIESFFSGAGKGIADFIEQMDFSDILGGISIGSLSYLFITIAGFIRNLSGGEGIVANITESFDNLNGTLGAMQNTLRAATLLQIAIAVGILAISMNTLSKIDADGLRRAAVAIGVLFAQLMTAMLLYEKFSGFTGFLKMPFIAVSMILLAAAVNVLASAVKKMSDLSWSELARGLTGTTVALGLLIAAAKLMPKAPSLILTASGLIVLGLALKVIASAAKDFAEMSWSEIARGLVAMAGALVIVGAALTLIPKTAILSAAGILVASLSLGMVADALQKMGQMSWGEIGKGLTAMLGALTIITAALYVIPPTAVLGAAGVLVVAMSMGMIGEELRNLGQMEWGEIGKGLTAMLGAFTIITLALSIIPPTAVFSAAAVLIVALALGDIADALKKMGDMSWGEIAKAMVVLAGSLTIIAVAVTAMILALPGAAALIVVAAALAILAPILKLFAGMSWGEIAKGLTMLAGAFLVIVAAGILLTPVVATLILFGAAVTLLGTGVLLTGAGVLLFATALTALAAAGGAATLALVGMVRSLANLIPMVMTKIGEGIAAFATAIAKAHGAIIKAIMTILLNLIKAITDNTPKIVDQLAKMLSKMLDTMQKHVPKMVDKGLKLLEGVLRGVANNIGKVTNTATDVIVEFLRGVDRNMPRVIDKGADTIIKFVNALARTIRNRSGEMRAAGRNLATAIIDGMTGGLLSGVGRVASMARSVAQRALDAAKSLLGISSPSKEFFKIGQWSSEGMADGLDKYSVLVSKSAENVGNTAIYSLKASLSDLANLIRDDIDLSPTITPVLDLSNVRKDAGRIGSMLTTAPISVGGSYSRAQVVSDTVQDNRAAADQQASVTNNQDVTFNQYNTSPKALSSAEIYRQTRNQLSIAKEELTK